MLNLSTLHKLEKGVLHTKKNASLKGSLGTKNVSSMASPKKGISYGSK